jgi:uncharacterized membrane protein
MHSIVEPLLMTTTSEATPKNNTDFLAKHRVEALADGLFAIVMTLLVLDLKVPELARNASPRELARAIASQWNLFFSFGMTFVLAAVFWMLQQRTLRLVHDFDKIATFLSLAPLLFVSLLPYSTATVGHYLNNGTASVLYFANQFLIVLFIALLWWRTTPATARAEEVREHRLIGIRVVALTVACLLAAVTAVFQPQYSWSAFVGAVLVFRVYQRRVLRT